MSNGHCSDFTGDLDITKYTKTRLMSCQTMPLWLGSCKGVESADRNYWAGLQWAEGRDLRAANGLAMREDIPNEILGGTMRAQWAVDVVRYSLRTARTFTLAVSLPMFHKTCKLQLPKAYIHTMLTVILAFYRFLCFEDTVACSIKLFHPSHPSART